VPGNARSSAGVRDKHPALVVVRGDVAALPFGAAAFEAVVCGEVLEHVADDAAAVAGIARVLRPGGVLVATVPAGRGRYGWLDRWAGHARRYDLADLRALVAGHGFKVLRLHHWGFPFGLLYERLVQRPVLGRHARHGAASPTAVRLGSAGIVNAIAGALFDLDHYCDAVPWGPGLLLVARRTG
jgi:SAM-dependent methyltransferase